MGHNYKKDTVVYQIYPRSFCDTTGNGIGDIPGIISKLEYIADLGINTIWLSPVYLSPNDDNGYDIADYKQIQPEFGTMADFEELVEKAKAYGIGIVMDLVINHTSDEHEWFKRALKGEEKYKNYYIIKKATKDKVPNNWGNFFAECPWTKFGNSEEEYYLHLFSKKQPDLNWHNPEVLEEIKDIMRFWLDKGVVGFRCDVINVIYKNSLNNGKKKFILTGSEHYLSTDGCHEILRTLREEVLEPYGAFAVGETVFVDIPKAKDLCDEERKELDFVFSFEHMECDQVVVKWFKRKLHPKKLMKTLTKWQKGLYWNATYFENHDQPRFISRFHDLKGYREQASKMIAGVLLTLRGTPFIYQGQEIGMVNGDFENLSEIVDIESHNVNAMARSLHLPKKMRWKMIKRTSRDNARTPMQWNDSENAGFSTKKTWLKVNKNYKVVNVENQQFDENSVFSFWKKMIKLRKENDILALGDFNSIYEGKSVYIFEREYEGKKFISVCNMSSKKQKFPVKHLKGKVIISNYASKDGDLMPFEFRLIDVK